MSIEKLRFVERDGKKLLQQARKVQITEPSINADGILGLWRITGEELHWEDVPLTVE